jgi:hypothetical protein
MIQLGNGRHQEGRKQLAKISKWKDCEKKEEIIDFMH